MDTLSAEHSDIKILSPNKFADPRGFFSETFNKKLLAAQGIEQEFVQDNHSLSVAVATVRGLHYQIEPFAQAKLIRVSKGRIYDVAVDLRRNSPTFGVCFTAELSADNWKQIFIPAGYAHGFCTLEPNTEVIYKVTNYYSPQHEFGIRWNDPDLNIAWPFPDAQITLSEKDRRNPLFKDVENWF
jgi:dTDP-4-dehydrorhamnose 3,5-epimerase